VLGCEHIGIQVRDIEQSVAYYRDLLGFKLVKRWAMTEPYVQKIVGYYPDVRLEIALLEIPGAGLELEILEYRNVPRTPVDPATANPGTAHFSLYVDDLDTLHRRLTASHVRFVSEVQTSVAGPNKGAKIVYMLDPDEIRVELVQMPARSLSVGVLEHG
jgi:catechol 2,3-dioxygenase-like lactoylglutathione lyase family enzyme